MKNDFYFILKDLFVFKIFKFLLWVFDYVEKTAWLKNQANFEIYDFTALVNKQLQYTYCQISHELKLIRQWNWSVNRIQQEKYLL